MANPPLTVIARPMSDVGGTMMAWGGHIDRHTLSTSQEELMAARTLPSGWPRQVPAPVGDQWVASAVAWLLDQCPAEYRGYPLLRRQPVVLAAFTAWHVQAQSDASRQGLAVARHQLRGVGVTTIEEALAVLERELARLQLLAREVAAVQHALSVRPLRGG